ERAERQLRLGDAPAESAARHWVFLDRSEGFLHTRDESAGEDGAVGGIAVVVFAGSDVAAGAVEMDVGDAGLVVLAQPPSQAGEVVADPAFAVVTLRMGSIIS